MAIIDHLWLFFLLSPVPQIPLSCFWNRHSWVTEVQDLQRSLYIFLIEEGCCFVVGAWEGKAWKVICMKVPAINSKPTFPLQAVGYMKE